LGQAQGRFFIRDGPVATKHKGNGGRIIDDVPLHAGALQVKRHPDRFGPGLPFENQKLRLDRISLYGLLQSRRKALLLGRIVGSVSELGSRVREGGQRRESNQERRRSH
jgi:hypothetical protein